MVDDRIPEIDAILGRLTVAQQPDTGDVAAAPIIDRWSWLPIGGQHIKVAGTVVGSNRFADGVAITTSAVVNVHSDRRWVRTQNSIYRLGWPAGEAWPPYLQVAANPDWSAAFETALFYTGEHTLTAAALVASGQAGFMESGQPPNWKAWRTACDQVATALMHGRRYAVAEAWRLLASDMTMARDRMLAEMIFAHYKLMLTDRELTAEERSAVEGWDMLAGSTDESVHDFGDLSDPIKLAHALAAEGERAKQYRGGRGLAFLVALEPNHQAARRRVVAAVHGALTGDEVGDLVLAADAIADESDNKAAAEMVGRFAPKLMAWGKKHKSDIASPGGELDVALSTLRAAGGIGPEAMKRIQIASRLINHAAADAVGRKIAGYAEAQLVCCAWALIAQQATAIGQASYNPDDDPFMLASAIADQLKINIRAGLFSPSVNATVVKAAIVEPAAEGVVVLREIGGTKETTSGKEVGREFKKIVGKRLPIVPPPDLTKARAALAAEFPHLLQQIDVILGDLAGAGVIRLRPTLMIGEPGGGKSRLARRLAEVLGVGLHRFDGAGSSDNTFGGTPRRWSSGEHCAPVEAVRRYEIANPICLVDEIDKAGTSRHNGSLAEALMPFLEGETSRNFPDPFLQTDVDLSHVSYILTANVDTSLSAPLRDRLRILRLPRPAIEHLPALARGIIADFACERAGDTRWWPALNEDEIEIAARLWSGGSVRKLRSIVERILAHREAYPRH